MITIISSALKHGLTTEDITQAFYAPIFTTQSRSHPPKLLRLGLGARHIIEIGYTINDDGTTVIFHAMPATKANLNLARRARKKQR
nr:hypothetical protein [Corynebacterium lactis]